MTTLFPKMIRIQQSFKSFEVDDVAASICAKIENLSLQQHIIPGQTVAIACSSRGISNYETIVRTVVKSLRKMQVNLFIIPAMGSHGAATAEGQQRVLEHLGITEAAVGAPVRSSLEVDQIGITEQGVPVFLDRLAHQADHLVLINRIKKHTEFEHKFESGLLKLMAIGLGKQKGAAIYHQAMLSYGYPDIISSVADQVMAKTNILFGVGIVENAHGKTAKIGICTKDAIVQQDINLLILAKELAPALPFEEVDILIIDEMGKEISGTGFDFKVVGRIGMPLVSHDPEFPKIKRILVCDLTAASEGNATGVGIADFITQRLYDKIDREALDMNSITGVSPEPGKIPLTLKNDHYAIEIAIRCVGLIPIKELKIMRIKNTAQLNEIEVSEAYTQALKDRPDLKIINKAYDLKFDQDGTLSTF